MNEDYGKKEAVEMSSAIAESKATVVRNQKRLTGLTIKMRSFWFICLEKFYWEKTFHRKVHIYLQSWNEDGMFFFCW